jgi:xeroderma pigmentosum group C-complementing protein
VKSLLNPDESKEQFRRSEEFMTGLKQVADIWRAAFKITERGMRRAYWVENDEDLKVFPWYGMT